MFLFGVMAAGNSSRAIPQESERQADLECAARAKSRHIGDGALDDASKTAIDESNISPKNLISVTP
jgi:hypothetical protein